MKNKLRNFIFIASLIVLFPALSAADSNQYSNWILKNSGVGADLSCVDIVNKNVFWVAGYNKTVLKSSNGAESWENVSVQYSVNLKLYVMAALNENICLVAGLDSVTNTAKLFRTSNGGLNWSVVFSQQNGWISGIKFKNATTGFMVGSPVGNRWSLWKTSNAGLTWDSTGLFLQKINNIHSYQNCLKISADNIWFGTSSYGIYHSSNFGGNWTFAPTPNLLNSFSLALSNNIGFAGGNNSMVTTTDYGESWIDISLPGFGPAFPIASSSNNFFYKRGGRIYYSSNYGTSFEPQDSIPYGLVDMDVFQDSNILIGLTCGVNGKIYFYKDSISNNKLCSVFGYTYKDLNGNGIWNSGEPPFQNIPVKIQSNNLTLYSYPNSAGFYKFFVPTGNYTLSVPNIPLYHSCSPNSHSVSLTYAGASIGPKNFGLYPLPNKQDLKLSLMTLGMVRPGFTFQYKISYKNIGTTTVSNNVTLNFDQRLTNVNSTPYGTISGNTLTVNYLNFLPGETREITVNATMPVSIPLNSVLCATATVNPLAGDITPYNNITNKCDTVRGSFDPNDKAVNHPKEITPSEILSGDSLIYTIRFQNTGNAEAINIFVKDSLSNNLDLGTFEMIAASHSYYYELDQDGVITWHFDNIMLPDSGSNQLLSNGYIKYSIKPKTTLVLNDSILNTAFIYFDYNPPVMTNTVINIVSQFSGTNPNSSLNPEKFHLSQNYPNPFNPTTKIKFDVSKSSLVNIEIFDVTGKLVRTLTNRFYQTGSYEITFNAENLSSGVYFYKMTAGEFSTVNKMIFLK